MPFNDPLQLVCILVSRITTPELSLITFRIQGKIGQFADVVCMYANAISVKLLLTFKHFKTTSSFPIIKKRFLKQRVSNNRTHFYTEWSTSAYFFWHFTSLVVRRNSDLQRDLNIKTVKEEIKKLSVKQGCTCTRASTAWQSA